MLILGGERGEVWKAGVCNFLWLAPPSLPLPASSLHSSLSPRSLLWLLPT